MSEILFLIGGFQSTLPARGATPPLTGGLPSFLHFNPRSPHGERPAHSNPAGASQSFQSTLPARGATPSSSFPASSFRFQSTLPARGATLRVPSFLLTQPFQSTLPARGATASDSSSAGIPTISIHAPRTGSDNAEANQKFRAISISIHAPRTGSDLSLLRFPANVHDFNPRSPHGERQPA